MNLSHQFENNVPIESGNTIEGIETGRKCQYENYLIQPIREVLDIHK
jgi:hypothetical protein